MDGKKALAESAGRGGGNHPMAAVLSLVTAPTELMGVCHPPVYEVVWSFQLDAPHPHVALFQSQFCWLFLFWLYHFHEESSPLSSDASGFAF